MKHTPKQLRARAAELRQQNRDIEDRYPGVRPSWISGEIGWNAMRADEHEAEADQLEAEMNAYEGKKTFAAWGGA